MATYQVAGTSSGETVTSSVQVTDSAETFDIEFNPRNVYNADNMSSPEDATILATGIAVNFVEKVLWAKHPTTGELVPIGMNEEQMRDIFQIKNAVTTDTVVETDPYIPSMKRVKASELGTIVQTDDLILVADKANAVILDVEDDNTVVVESMEELPEGELGRQNVRRLNKPGDTLKAYDQKSYLPVAQSEEEKPFIFDPALYDGYGTPLPNGSNASPNVMAGEVEDMHDALNHLFGLAGNGLSTLIDAGIKVGLPVRHGMTLKEYVEVILSIAGVNLTLKGFTYVTQRSHYKFRRNALSSVDFYIRDHFVSENDSLTSKPASPDIGGMASSSGYFS